MLVMKKWSQNMLPVSHTIIWEHFSLCRTILKFFESEKYVNVWRRGCLSALTLCNLNSYAEFNLPQPHLHWVIKNLLNHEMLSQSFNTNTSRWEPNVHLRGKLIIITAFCNPFYYLLIVLLFTNCIIALSISSLTKSLQLLLETRTIYRLVSYLLTTMISKSNVKTVL